MISTGAIDRTWEGARHLMIDLHTTARNADRAVRIVAAVTQAITNLPVACSSDDWKLARSAGETLKISISIAQRKWLVAKIVCLTEGTNPMLWTYLFILLVHAAWISQLVQMGWVHSYILP